MDFAGLVLRWLQLGAGLGLIGSFFLLLLAGPSPAAVAGRWRNTLLRATRWQAVLLVFVGAGLLMVQTVSVTGQTESSLRWTDVSRLLENSRFGQVWQVRQGLALALIVLLAFYRPAAACCGERTFQGVLLAIALAHASAAVLTGHGAATEPIWLAGSGHLVHLLAAGIWAGGLPALAYGLVQGARSADRADAVYFASALRRFSVAATVSVLLIVASGAVIGYLQLGALRQWPGGANGMLAGVFTLLERTAAPLLATEYGLLVLAKVVLLVPILGLAARVRFVWLPRLGPAGPDQRTALAAASRLVRTELAVVMVLLLAAAAVSATLPAAHDQLVWPFPFRFSVAATWAADSAVMWRVVIGAAVVVAAVALGLAMRQRSRRHAWPLAALGALGGLAVALPALTVDAYPDTYRRTDTPYAAVSVARGAELYAQHCVACHGAGGRGDGPAAARLPKPAANLTEPHTALHTAGDIFWWLTHGKPEGGMPGFAAQMSVEERWDVVNFLRAFSAGFQARILTSSVVRGKPWLGSPDFDFSTATGRSGALKEYRDQRAVLLVFYSWPASRVRLDQLARSYPDLRARNAEVLAIPLPGSAEAPPNAWPYPAVTDGGRDAAMAYLLFRRTLTDPGRTVLGEQPPHLEFLIDRFGYARARWFPGDGSGSQRGWDEMSVLLRQVDLLNAEPRILPPPDDHVH